MRAAARKFSALVGRHRWAVGATWLIILVAALPLAAKQTENLTGGGFDVPGSESSAVEKRMQESYGAEAGQNSIGAVLQASGDASPEDLAAVVSRLEDTVNGVE